MRPRKITSGDSEPTQPERPRRFIRRNSFCTLNCRSGSLRKSRENNPQTQQTPEKPAKPQREQQKLFNDLETFEPVLRRCSGSMRVDSCRMKEEVQQGERMDALRKELQLRVEEVELLAGQCKRLKAYVAEEREKRRQLQEDVKCSQQEIKRLEKRLERYRAERAGLEKERELLQEHVQQLEGSVFNSQTRDSQSYREKYQQLELERLRQELQKGRSQREEELLRELTLLNDQKYQLDAELRAAKVGHCALSKQLEDNDQEMEQIRRSMHQAVICSTEYTQLRERYRKVLMQCRELKEEVGNLQRSRSQAGRALLDHTLLTLSDSNTSWQE